MKQIIALLLALVLLLGANLPVSAEGQAFNFQFWMNAKTGTIGDTMVWTWRYEPKEDSANDLLYLHVYLQPGAELISVTADGDLACATLATGFACTSNGMTGLNTVIATVKLIGPGEMIRGRQFYAHAIGGAYAGGAVAHTIEVRPPPTNLDPAAEPTKRRVYLPLLQGE